MEKEKNEHVRVLIAGSGPAGYTAAIYASRANLHPVLIDGELQGGQLTQTTTIENYPGFPNGRNGFDLMDDMRVQAANLGAEMRSGTIVDSDLNRRPFSVRLDDGSVIETDVLIIATGASARHLGLTDEERYAGKGVSYCATCDGFFYRNKDVAVVGGGDTALEEALYLAGLANRVYLVVRRDVMRASKVMQERVAANSKIEVLRNYKPKALYGEDRLERAILEHSTTGEEKEIWIDGLFVAIGHNPTTTAFPQVETDEQGYVRLYGHGQQTNLDGVFACGDVCDPHYRQAITAAAAGCRAAMDAERYLMERK